MNIKSFTLSPYRTNGYLLYDNGKAVFIDPGDESEEVFETIRKADLELTHVLITHMHSDHFFGAAKLARETGAEIVGGEKDAFMVESEILEAPRWGFRPLKEHFSFTPIAPGEHTFVDRRCRVLPTPGHSPGSLTFYFPEEKIAFVGDLIFYRGIGRTDFTGGNLEELHDSVRTRIFTLPDDTTLYPGHDVPTTVGDEKAHNPHYRD
jgi:glyoxylase-like metal-dependent hydrolase (beta-lactamase superfamily II)